MCGEETNPSLPSHSLSLRLAIQSAPPRRQTTVYQQQAAEDEHANVRMPQPAAHGFQKKGMYDKGGSSSSAGGHSILELFKSHGSRSEQGRAHGHGPMALSAATVWCLVGNGGMDPYSSPYIIPNNRPHSPFPLSFLRTRQAIAASPGAAGIQSQAASVDASSPPKTQTGTVATCRF